MKKSNPKSFTKKKSEPNAVGPMYRTSDHFKGKVFGGGRKPTMPMGRINSSSFRTQHKG